jgi:putative transposase
MAAHRAEQCLRKATDSVVAECIGWEFARRGRAKEAERALEEAGLARFGTLRLSAPTPVIRSDDGLIYQRRCFRAVGRDYRLRQEFIPPYMPQQNGLVERLSRSRTRSACPG